MDPKDTAAAPPTADVPVAATLDPARPVGPPAAAAASDAPAAEHPHHHRWSTQLVLLATIAGSFALFWWVGVALGIPARAGYGASLLHQPVGAAALAIVTAAVLLLAVTFCTELLVGRIWLYAGPLAAAAGLAAWSFRGGPAFFVLVAPDVLSTGTGVFRQLALEAALLGAMFAGIWALLYRWFRPPVGEEEAFTLVPDADVAQFVVTQAVLMAVGVILFVQTGEKKQAFFGVMLAAFLATIGTRGVHRGLVSTHWCWAGPFVVAVVGYLVTSLGAAGQVAVQTGALTTALSSLARPLPLDYASAGVVGALLGMAMTGEEWQEARPRPAKG